MAMPPIPCERPYFIIKDEILTASLKAKKINETCLEADMFYFPLPVEAGKKEAPYLIRLALLVEADKRTIAAQRFPGPGEDSVCVMIDMIVQYIKANGRPKTLFVRDDWAGYWYGDFCAKIGISMDTENGVPLLDEIAEDMMGRFALMNGAVP
jgi:hypothetical protein